MKQEISTRRLVEATTLIRYSESVVGERHVDLICTYKARLRSDAHSWSRPLGDRAIYARRLFKRNPYPSQIKDYGWDCAQHFCSNPAKILFLYPLYGVGQRHD